MHVSVKTIIFARDVEHCRKPLNIGAIRGILFKCLHQDGGFYAHIVEGGGGRGNRIPLMHPAVIVEQ